MEQNKNIVANFIQKTYDILENSNFSHIIEWTENGKQFSIKDIELFESTILPQYFRHRNIHSFIRQLNMYGFHKSRKDLLKNVFSHPNFLKAMPHELIDVRRKIKTEQKIDENLEFKLKSQVKKTSQKKKAIATNVIAQCYKSTFKITSIIQLASQCSIAQMQEQQQVEQCFQNNGCQSTPFKGIIEKSQIFDQNPELGFKLSMMQIQYPGFYSIELLEYIEDNKCHKIDEERKFLQTRLSGVSLIRTYDFLNQMQF